MKLGIAKTVITPMKPVRMCGYGNRVGAFDGVTEDIYTRVHAYEAEGKRAIFCYADLIWFNSDVIPMFRDALKAAGVKEDEVVFFTSHNHSGPGTGKSLTALLESCDDEYRDWLIERVVETVKAALADMEDVDLMFKLDNLDLNVNRRKMVNGAIAMVPNYDAPCDRKITLFKSVRKDGSVKGMMVHYPCHANLNNGNTIHGDYPGAALRMLDEQYPGSISIFMQGCTGDIRPNSTIGNVFCPADRERVLRFATIFKDKVVEMSENCTEVLPATVEAPVCTSFNLPLDQTGVRERAEAATYPDKQTEQWAELVKAKNYRPYETMILTKTVLGGVPMIFFNSEVVQSYAEKAREYNPRCITTGYTNGMIGYIANSKQIDEGGYEPCGSAIWFALAGTYKNEIEDIIVNEIEKAVKGEMK